jgi:predicted small lipoprotein YifL
MNRESNLFPDATLNYDVSGCENQSKKEKPKQNKTSNSISSAATTGFLNLKPSQKLYHFFPTPLVYPGGRKKTQQTTTRTVPEKKTQTLPYQNSNYMFYHSS